MGGCKYRDFKIRGRQFADVAEAAAAMGRSGTTIRRYLREGRADEIGLTRSGPPGNPVRVVLRTGEVRDFPSQRAAAAFFGKDERAIHRRLQAGRANDIALDHNHRGLYRAKPFRVGPFEWRSMAQASRELGFGPGYVEKAMSRGSARMKARILEAAMRLEAEATA